MKDFPEDLDVFKKGAWGIMWHPIHGWAMLTPHDKEGAIVPDEALAMTAVFIRLQKDRDFLEENLDMFTKGALPGGD